MAAKLAAFFDTANISNCAETNHLQAACYNYTATTKTTKKQGIGTGRIDQYFGQADHLYLTANWGVLSQTNTSIRAGQGGQVYTRPKLFGASWTHTFGPRLLNQATLGYSRDHYLNGTNTAYGPNLSQQVGLANTNQNPATFDLPQVSIFNYQGFGGGEPTTYADNIYQGVDTVTMIRGRHTLNFGIDLRRIQLFELDNYLGPVPSLQWRVHRRRARVRRQLARQQRSLQFHRSLSRQRSRRFPPRRHQLRHRPSPHRHRQLHPLGQ